MCDTLILFACWSKRWLLRLEVQHHSGAGSDQQKTEIQKRIWRSLRRMLPHREQRVDHRRAAKNQRHNIVWNAAALERIDDAHRSNCAQRASDRGHGDAASVEAAQPALRAERDE